MPIDNYVKTLRIFQAAWFDNMRHSPGALEQAYHELDVFTREGKMCVIKSKSIFEILCARRRT